jgi:large subunit ribosomal protein L1
LMPSKKLGTVVPDLAEAVKRAKAGAVELRADRAGVVHCGLGKLSMSDDALLENLKAAILCVENNKPIGVKGKKWVKSAFITSSMGPSHPLNLNYIDPKNVRFMSKE